MHSNPIIQCENIYKSYGTKEAKAYALVGVNLSIEAGETLMLIGPSGCGKTTLISIIAGTLQYDSGTCLVFGQDLQKMSPEELIEWRGKNIGFIFQSYNLIPTLTVAENVALPLFIQGMNPSDAIKKATVVLANVELDHKASAKVTELSGGQQQRVAIARSLIHEPKILVCDEPTSALDAKTGFLVMKILKDISKSLATTVIIVTHDHRILSFADRIAALEDGKIQSVKLTSEFIHQ
jgi:putative ABC transport system ATP-binding protein